MDFLRLWRERRARTPQTPVSLSARRKERILSGRGSSPRKMASSGVRRLTFFAGIHAEISTVKKAAASDRTAARG